MKLSLNPPCKVLLRLRSGGLALSRELSLLFNEYVLRKSFLLFLVSVPLLPVAGKMHEFCNILFITVVLINFPVQLNESLSGSRNKTKIAVPAKKAKKGDIPIHKESSKCSKIPSQWAHLRCIGGLIPNCYYKVQKLILLGSSLGLTKLA